MSETRRTPLYDRHRSLGAKMVEFVGWDMPIMYPRGIVEEHLSTRKTAGLFDVSHMGRFIVKGHEATPFLQHVLTNNAEALDRREAGAQYTLVPNESGGAVDDAYLYRFVQDAFLLVVNAANRDKDWEHLQEASRSYSELDLIDCTDQISMIALQGPRSRHIMEAVVESGKLPDPIRNATGIVTIAGRSVQIARTGYTGEPVCYELFVPAEAAAEIWDLLHDQGAIPVGLGARDTLRLEAGLPLYGHELGTDPEGKEIPILACPLTRFAVSFTPLKGDFVGREELLEQFQARAAIQRRDYTLIEKLPRIIRPVAITGRGVAREGARVFKGERHVGFITSGTMVPYWKVEGSGLESSQADSHALRGLCLALIDSDILDEEALRIEVRGRMLESVVVPYHLRNDAPPFARPIVAGWTPQEEPLKPPPRKAEALLEKAIENHIWRQGECINLIPSEMTASPLVRLLSVMDPAFRYAEHRKVRAFYDTDVFYYQGTGFIAQVERLLRNEFQEYLGCRQVETRMISGQMANTAVFSAMVQYLNREDPKREPRRISPVMNHHIGKGGHLSSQPMGALRDFVALDSITERPDVVPFPVLPENPYKVDVAQALERIEQARPRLIIFGKSMVLYKEPVREIRSFLDESDIDAVVLYDMAHVLGLVGEHFQQPFAEGADLVTGSTHKTFFGPQRGIAASCFTEQDERFALWEAVESRTFPGSVSNHHLGTMLALLMACYEMNHFKGSYQPRVIENAKAFARALSDGGLDVAGDPADGFTQTHQVIVNVGYGRGPEIASRLESNNIICNYQATPDEEGFTASGALRLGVSEMTRFGMDSVAFEELAGLIRDAVIENARVKDDVIKLRSRFLNLRYCFEKDGLDPFIEKLHGLIH